MPLDSIHTHAAAAYSRLVRDAAQFLTQSAGAEGPPFEAFAGSCVRPLLPPATDAAVWLAMANRQADWVPVALLAKHWLPYAFHPRTREVSWCLPVGRAVQPFHDEYISHCRRHLVNALVSPRCSIDSLLDYARGLRHPIEPAGFIFHLSRCGSTLVSGSLAVSEQCSVLSESALLTDILLAGDLRPADKKRLLRLCLHLQGGAVARAARVVVKWNAWDLCHWRLIRQIWPQVPALLLTRDPLEILASHGRSAGRHMSGDPALAGVHDVFADRQWAGPLHFRIAVLELLMAEMLQACGDARAFLLDYSALDAAAMLDICRRFGIDLQSGEGIALQEKMAYHSKIPAAVFQPDTGEKRRQLPAEQVAVITSALATAYGCLISKSNK